MESMRNSYLTQDINCQHSQENRIINIEMIPKIDSILICLNLLNEFKNELVLYSQEVNNKIVKIVKLFTVFFNISLKNVIIIPCQHIQPLI